MRFLWMLMDMNLPKFNIYQGTVATNCFKSYTNSWYHHFFQEKVLSDVRSEIHLVWRNIVSTGQYVWTIHQKIYIQAWGNHVSLAEMKWTDADGVYHWIIFRSSYRKLVWLEYLNTHDHWIPLKTTELSGHYIYIYIYIYIYTYIYI